MVRSIEKKSIPSDLTVTVIVVIMGCVSGYHPTSAKAMIEGLGERKRRTNKDVHYIHVGLVPPFKRPSPG